MHSEGLSPTQREERLPFPTSHLHNCLPQNPYGEPSHFPHVTRMSLHFFTEPTICTAPVSPLLQCSAVWNHTSPGTLGHSSDTGPRMLASSPFILAQFQLLTRSAGQSWPVSQACTYFLDLWTRLEFPFLSYHCFSNLARNGKGKGAHTPGSLWAGPVAPWYKLEISLKPVWTALLRYNFQTIEFTHTKCAMQWFLVCSQSCVVITIV